MICFVLLKTIVVAFIIVLSVFIYIFLFHQSSGSDMFEVKIVFDYLTVYLPLQSESVLISLEESLVFLKP